MIGLLQLASADIAQVQDIIAEVKSDPVFGEDFAPKVRIVGKDHWAFSAPGKNKRVAMAARDDQGQEWLLINREADPKDLRPVTQHELSHFSTWRKYGEKVSEHGPQFRRECRRLVDIRPNYFCKGYN